MQDRAMNPDRANAQANPNPNANPNANQQQQHQPQADVEVDVDAEGQAVAEQQEVAQQPILHGVIMNPIIAQPRVDEQHPQAAEQANIAAEAEVEGEEPILHEPIPQGEAIINPQGSIINAEEEGQGDAEEEGQAVAEQPQQHPEAAEQAIIAEQAIMPPNVVEAILNPQRNATEQEQARIREIQTITNPAEQMGAITQYLQGRLDLQRNEIIHAERALTPAKQAADLIIQSMIPIDQMNYVRIKGRAMKLLEKFRKMLFFQLEYEDKNFDFHEFDFTEPGIMIQFLKEIRLYIGLNMEVRSLGWLSNNAMLYCYFISFQIYWYGWNGIDFNSSRFREILNHFETAVKGYPSVLPDDIQKFVSNMTDFLKIKLQAWEIVHQANFSKLHIDAQIEILGRWFEDFFVDNTFLRIL